MFALECDHGAVLRVQPITNTWARAVTGRRDSLSARTLCGGRTLRSIRESDALELEDEGGTNLLVVQRSQASLVGGEEGKVRRRAFAWTKIFRTTTNRSELELDETGSLKVVVGRDDAGTVQMSNAFKRPFQCRHKKMKRTRLSAPPMLAKNSALAGNGAGRK